MNGITTHVLDTVLGKPAIGVPVRLERLNGNTWIEVGSSATDTDGRCRDLLAAVQCATYRLTFTLAEYFRGQGRLSLYPEISITFACNGDAHYHIPLLLSENSYTTYRGS